MALRLVSIAKDAAPAMAEPAARHRRRLMAVMLADVVNYSHMMSRSEDETHARVSCLARELIDPTISRHGGRIVRSMGDGWLAEFASATDVVRCALEIQRGLATRQADEPDQIKLRIGINTGDVLVDQHDIYGNSVNIAARLESLASPGAICVSQSIYDQARSQPGFFFADRGTQRVKNIPYPIRVYEVSDQPIRLPLRTRLAVHWGSLAVAAGVAAVAVLATAGVLVFGTANPVVARTNKIVVLPFNNIGGSSSDDYLADAITEDLTSELARLPRAWVIASGTAFTYKDRPDTPSAIGRELKVRYALQGSVRRAGPIVRVNARLIDTDNGANLWDNSFAYETSSLADLQDNMLGRIATSLNDEVTVPSLRHEIGTLAADHNPLDERMRAMAATTGYPTPEKFLESRQNAEAGLKADPDNARLLALLAHVLMGDVLNGWNGAGKAEVDRAETAARKAIGLDRNVALAHFALGYVLRLRGDHPASLASFQEAIRIDPNFARAYAQAANALVFVGKPAEAIPMVEQALQLSPNDPAVGVFYWVKGRAYFTLGDYPKAIEALSESARVRPNLWYVQAWLAAAHALTDQAPKASETLVAFNTKFGSEYTLDRITRYYQEEQYQNPTLQAASAHVLEGLRKAGMK
ncbi:adenylate/guanylate cyclase domain-containing protein [Bradyrhizobium sp. STM 3557]|uniref:adenylate/guanylate cyclase domain-containing protein n=1 Tax=Bradyrhizobium sp. STM 3557 TaxID=578920 RepID=UPI00388D3C9C